MTIVAVAAAPQFGDVLKSWRRRRGVTQQQLADLSTVSVRAIRDLEIGRVARPRRDTLRLICDALGLTGRARADFHAAATPAGDGFDESLAPAPVVFDALLGRDDEVAAVREALSSGQRFVEIVGLAGAGKTRLAIEAVRGLPVLWAGRAGEAGAGGGETAALIRAALQDSVGAHDQLSALIRDRQVVLVSDGSARVSAKAVTALLRACGGLTVLVTSRTPVAAGGVWSLPLKALAEPDAVLLLMRHVRRELPSFRDVDAVRDLCRRLDGLPGALVAAAPWFLMHEPGVPLHRIDPGLAAAIRGAVEALEPAGLELLRRPVSTVDTIDAIRGLCARGLLTAEGRGCFSVPLLVFEALETAGGLPPQAPVAAPARA